MPMQGPQAHSSTRAPLERMSASAPQAESICKTCLEPGEMERLTVGATVLPFKMARHAQKVAQRGVGAGADADLIDAHMLKLARRLDVVRRVRAGAERFERG